MCHMIGDESTGESCDAIIANFEFFDVSEAADGWKFANQVAISQITVTQLDHSAGPRNPQTSPFVVIGQSLTFFRVRYFRDRTFTEEIRQGRGRHGYDSFSSQIAHTLGVDCFRIQLTQELLHKFDIFLQFEEFLLRRVSGQLPKQFGDGWGRQLRIVVLCQLAEQGAMGGQLRKVELVDPLLQGLFIFLQSLQIVPTNLSITLSHLSLKLIHDFSVAFAFLDLMLQGGQREEVVVDGLVACLAAADTAAPAPLPLRNALILSHVIIYSLVWNLKLLEIDSYS